MKKLIRFTPVILSVLFLLFPVLWGICSLIGYTFTLYSLPATYTVLTVLAVGLTVADAKMGNSVHQINGVFAILLLPITAISVFLFIFKCSGSRLLLLYIAFLAILSTVCAFIVFFKYAKKLKGWLLLFSLSFPW